MNKKINVINLSLVLIIVVLTLFVGKPVSFLAATEESLSMTVNGESVNVIWEDNDSVTALKELAKEKDITIETSQYGGFEQVGAIGATLPSNDTEIKTSPGDIVLYNDDQMVIFYGSNTWDYTRLGKITGKTDAEIKEMLGDSGVTIRIHFAESESVDNTKITEPEKPDDVAQTIEKDKTAADNKIVLKPTSIRKLAPAKKSFTVKWKKQPRQTTGYQIRYSLKKNFKSGTKTMTVKGAKKTSAKISKLKSKKTYYVRIRTYKTVKGKKYYSSWSKVKIVRTK